MKPSPNGRKWGNNRIVDRENVSDDESDEFTEEGRTSNHGEASLPMKPVRSTSHCSETGVSVSDRSAGTDNQFIPERAETPLESQENQSSDRESEIEAPTTKPISKFKVFLACASTVFYVIFNVMRFYDTVIYQTIGNLLFYSLTSIFYILSAIVTTCFSANINKLKRQNRRENVPNFKRLGIFIGAFFVIEIYHVFLRLIFLKQIFNPGDVALIIFKYSSLTISIFIAVHMLTLDIYVLMPIYAFKCWKSQNREEQQHYYNLWTETQADVGLLGILDGSFRAVPLQVMQIAIFAKSKYNLENLSDFEEIGLLLSFVVIAWCSTSYQSSLRVQLPNKHDMDITSFSWYYIWNFFMCFSRTLCVGAAASFWPLTTTIAALVHCGGWAFWLCWNHPPLDFCHKNKYAHVLFCCVVGVVYFTFPINLDDKPTKKRYCIFYSLVLFENLLGIIVWYNYEKTESWNHIGLFLAIASSFFGLICLLVYYILYHPNKLYSKNITAQ